MHDDHYFLQELPAIPKELREQFPGKLHLWTLWALIRRFEDSASHCLPCRLPYKTLAILLQKEMGAKQPYRVKTISNYLRLLRKNGWIQTFELFYPNIRRIGVACPGHSGISHPETIYANYARSEGNGETAIITCVFRKDGVEIRPARGAMLACPGQFQRVPPLLFTNVNNVLVEKISSFCGAKKREIRGILNMKGFHDYFEKTDKPTDRSLADAKRLFAVLLECGTLKGKKVSLEKWAFQLEQSHRKFPSFPEVFDLLIASLPFKPWLRSAVQSPRALHKKFANVEEWLKQTPTKSKYDLPPDFELYEVEINSDCIYFQNTHPEVCELILSIHPDQLKRAIYDNYQFIHRVDEAIRRIGYPLHTQMDDCVNGMYTYLQSEKTYRKQVGINMERLQEWSKTGWKGHLVGRNNIGMVQVDEGQQVSIPARKYLTNLVNKTTARTSIKQRVIDDIIEELEK